MPKEFLIKLAMGDYRIIHDGFDWLVVDRNGEVVGSMVDDEILTKEDLEEIATRVARDEGEDI